MKFRYLLVCLAVLIGSVFYLQLARQEQNTRATFSPVAVNSTNLIDINKLTLEDYKHISEENGAVFVSKKDFHKQVYFDDKQLQSLEMSPSQTQTAFYYSPNETDELKESELSLMIFDLTNKSVKEVFHTTHPSWDVRSDLHWLGNNHIIFMRNCGTSCQGLTMLNIQTGVTKNATLSYMFSSDQLAYTHFDDWFENEHKMNNLVNTINTEAVDGKFYLIFEMMSEAGETSGQKKYLFTGDSLILDS
ncbi:MAG TPA: hypothetical protein PKX78_01870 [Candidatus Woesebacteria bacterium]|nr:hypothetical protein [Candidatus Woesebacteria bacterium]